MRILWLGIAAALLAPGGAPAAIRFQEVSAAAGIDYVGRSWGSAWTDVDGDGDPDLWLVNHQNAPHLYRNEGNGTFTDIAPSVLAPEFLLPYDKHGAAWADYDNDGDPDLYQLADEGSGGPVPAWLFRNDGGTFAEVAASLGVDLPLGRGRMPLWLDHDRDGRMDLLHNTTRRGDGSDVPTALFHQVPGGFVDVAGAAGLVPNTTNSPNFALLGDLTRDGRADLVTHLNRFPENVYDTVGLPFSDLQAAVGLPTTCCVADAVIADLDGDLDNDVYLVRGEEDQEIVLVDPFTLEAHLQGSSALPPFFTETGLSFRTAGDVTVDPYPGWNVGNVFIGAAGASPAALPFTLSPADTAAWGIFPHAAGVDTGLYVGYDPATGSWQILRTNKVANLVITSPAPISEVLAINWDPAALPRTDVLLADDGAAFLDRTLASGITEPGSGRAVVAADFDNDMDLDLYIVRTGPVSNRLNRLYENLGGGAFAEVADAGGAAGDSLGRGESVSVADYDGDGFLDLLVTNGISKAPFDADGPTHLFRNEGNGNHWIGIDLVGGLSNRDGTGARLLATAGGVTQLREQNGGVHHRGQNHARVHFGLGSHAQVDTLRISWPGGTEQTLVALPADQVVTLVEPGATAAPIAPAAPARLQLRPHPVRRDATIAFSLEQSERVTLTVHDVTGRCIRRLASGTGIAAGEHTLAWDVRDGRGRRLRPGVYFLRLEAGTHRETSRVVVVATP